MFKVLAAIVATGVSANSAAPIMSLLGSADLADLERTIIRMARQPTVDLTALASEIKTLIDETILPDLNKQLASSQKDMDSLDLGFSLCDAAVPDTPTPTNYSDAHTDCRTQESQLQSQWNYMCNVLVPKQARLYASSCLVTLAQDSNPSNYLGQVPDICDNGNSANASALEQHYLNIANYFQAKLDAWEVENSGCVSAKTDSLNANSSCATLTSAYAAQTATCNQAQKAMDDQYCQGSILANNYCAKKLQCYQLARATYLSHNTTIAAVEASLKTEYRAMQNIACLLGAFSTSSIDLVIQDCNSRTYTDAPMTIQYKYFAAKAPVMPNLAGCANPDIPQPGTDQYNDAFYATLPRNAPASPCTSQCCTVCSYYPYCGSSPVKTTAASIVGFSQNLCCEAACSVSPPVGGGVGNCSSSLGSRKSCLPTCGPGYTVSGTTTCTDGTLNPATCADVNECATGSSNCDPHASCTNTVGSFTCQCNPGYAGSGVSCWQR